MSRIVGFGDLQKKEERKEDRNELFAGGFDQRGGGSGLAVEGPPRPPNTGSAFDRIVQNATSDQASSDKPTSGPQTTITLYQNGFIVNDGPFRESNSPENQAFIQTLEAGNVPAELQTTSRTVYVNLVDKRGETYTPPPPPAYVAFSGTGTRLQSDSANETFVFIPMELVGAEFVVDESHPTTTLQIRTSAGQRIRVKMNQSHTVQNLAAHVLSVLRSSSRGEPSPFTLSSGFPPKDLTNPHATLLEAGLVGAAVTHKEFE